MMICDALYALSCMADIFRELFLAKIFESDSVEE